VQTDNPVLKTLKAKMVLHQELSGKGGYWFVSSSKAPTLQDAEILGVGNRLIKAY
jgi:hypothetical protein